VWAGTLSAGAEQFPEREVHHVHHANGLASTRLPPFAEGSDGTMVFGTPNGLNAFSNGNGGFIRVAKGYLRGTVNCVLAGIRGRICCGLERRMVLPSLISGIVRTPPDEPASLHEQILGIEGGQGLARCG